MKDDFEDLGDFEDVKPKKTTKKTVVVKPEVTVTESIYKPELDWTINTGMQNTRLTKLYSLFTDKHSLFYLGKDVSVLGEQLDGAASFASKHNDHQIHLYTPSRGYAAYYNTDSKEDPGYLESNTEYEGIPGFQRRLDEIALQCASANKPTTFVVPFMEMPINFSKGVQHQVLLTISYDPKTKQMTPLVYDSIGRDTLSETFSTLLKSKYRSTCDEVLHDAIQEAVGKAGGDLTASKLRRVDYNHQNRLTEGNCGSYTFRTIKEVISSAANGTSVMIPGSGYVTSDSFLTSKHAEEIEGCIKYRTLSSTKIYNSLTTGDSLTVDYSEFLSGLRAYEESRAKKPEKNLWNFGYSKEAKTSAVTLLAGILQDMKDNKLIEESRYQKLQGQTGCLMDGTLGMLINYHLNKLGVSTINQLVEPSVKDEFVMINDEGLFDVVDIDGNDLAIPTIPLPNKLDLDITAKQETNQTEKFKTELTIIKGENEDDENEFVMVTTPGK